MAEALRFGILGTGNIAGQFARGVAGAAGSVVTAVGSRRDQTAAAFAERHAVPTAHGSYDALLADPQVDAIYLSLPNAMHGEWTIRALEAGKHVLCEKPLARNADEAEQMFQAADRAGRLLVEAFMYRCHPLTRAVLDKVRGGAIGQLHLARLNFCFHTTKVADNIRFSVDLAGGAIMDIGCYPISLAVLLADDEPEHVHCAGRLHASGVDESAGGVLRFPSGLVVVFTCSMQTQADNTAHLCGTDGFCQVPVPWKPPVQGAEYRVRTMARPKMEAGPKPEPIDQVFTVDAPAPLYGMEADAFAAAVRRDAEPFMPRRHSLITMRILDACRRQVGLAY